MRPADQVPRLSAAAQRIDTLGVSLENLHPLSPQMLFGDVGAAGPAASPLRPEENTRVRRQVKEMLEEAAERCDASVRRRLGLETRAVFELVLGDFLVAGPHVDEALEVFEDQDFGYLLEIEAVDEFGSGVVPRQPKGYQLRVGGREDQVLLPVVLENVQSDDVLLFVEKLKDREFLWSIRSWF